MDLGGQVRHGEDIPMPLSAQFTGALSPAVMQDTAAKLKLLASGNGAGTPMTPADTKGKPMRYRECQKNHAAGIGGHALDGCGEFLPCGEDPIESLKCAACGCHRNFHRIEIEGESPCQLCIHRKERKRSLMLTSPDHDEGQYLGSPSSSMKKRFRTKFTGDQKERMLSFADKLGWKIQKHDEAEVQQFCNEVGVKRHVLKVWMHNNKHTLGKKI